MITGLVRMLYSGFCNKREVSYQAKPELRNGETLPEGERVIPV